MSPVFLCHGRFCITPRAEVGFVKFWDIVFIWKSLINMPNNRPWTERGWERKREGQKKGGEREEGKGKEKMGFDESPTIHFCKMRNSKTREMETHMTTSKRHYAAKFQATMYLDPRTKASYQRLKKGFSTDSYAETPRSERRESFESQSERDDFDDGDDFSEKGPFDVSDNAGMNQERPFEVPPDRNENGQEPIRQSVHRDNPRNENRNGQGPNRRDIGFEIPPYRNRNGERISRRDVCSDVTNMK